MARILFISILFLQLACSKTIEKRLHPIYAKDVSANVITKPRADKYRSSCKDPLNYVPDTLHPDHFLMKRVRINWHSVDDSSKQNNFTLEESNTFYGNLTQNANYRLSLNKKMTLPIGNKTPVYDPHLRWVISPTRGRETNNGIYHHVQKKPLFFMNRGPNRSDYNTSVIDELGISKDSIVNVFVVPFPPDSMKKQSYRIVDSGIALGNHIKLGGLKQTKRPDWLFATLLSHEIGHVFGLSHAWHSDGCDDTPNNPNCWNYSNDPPCDKLVSNNLMDYNSEQMSITPCQIGVMQMNIADTLNSKRKLVIPDWCSLDTNSIIITDTINWLGFRDINKSIIIEKGGILKVCCRLGMPQNSSITVKAGGTLILEEVILHNDCNHTWKGIFIEQDDKLMGKVEKIGSVKILDIGI